MASAESESKLKAVSQEAEKSVRSLLGKVAKIAGQTQNTAKVGGEAILGALKEGATTTAERAAQVTAQAEDLAQETGETFKSAVGAVGQRIHPVASAASTLASSVGAAANQTSQLAQSTSVDLGQNLSKTLAQATEQTTQRLGKTLRYINDNPLLKRAAGIVPANWLLDIAQKVDRDQAAAGVERLRAAHPQDSQAQLAHRLMVQKTLLASGMGLASNLLPGAATALFALDLAATVMLQVEMIYQIALIYGLDLDDPQREGEMVAIFGLAMGGQKAAQVGATYLATAGISSVFENIPIAGALIGASSNAALNYAIGYAACRFYQAKTNDAQATPLESETALQQAEQAGEQYLAQSIDQQRIMDQLLSHAVVMAYPEEQWADIPKALESLALQPESRAAIAQHLASPEPLDQLLERLEPDYALPLVAQCQRLAQADGEITCEEQRLLEGLKAQLA